ncbi:hypothetical protein GQX73_g5289 [Xylaria multiplex]|uniref:Fumarylacetoacetase-like C-terminal domain-containing protein n=1 Tax=Xylaria multiplex TaxID=323545 RepID=A0A7C8IWV2_9PEZI|nr:hypothetical protein GQX73_g5289 [Xylaria multiplex]
MNRLTVTNHVFTLGRLILLRLLYLSYITFYELPESYQSSYEAIEHGIKPLPTWPDYLGLSKWLTEYPYTDLTRVESLGLAIAIAVVFLGLIHGSCRRLIELIDVPIRWERSPLLAVLRTIARSTLFLPSEIQTVLPNHLIQVLFSLILLLNFLIVSHITLNTIPMPLVYEAFNRPGGSLLNTLFIIFKSIFWGDWDVRTTFIRLYFVFFVVYLGLSFLYAMLLTLWEDIFWPGLCIFSTHAALKLLFPYFDGLVPSKKRRAEYNLVLDAELAKLAKAISEAHESSREMREAGVFWPGKAELMIGLDQVLGHIVIEPLQSFCEAIYELLRDIPQEITSESDAAEARRLLVRTLWKLSQGGLVGGSTDGAKIDGYEVSLGAERAFKWVLEDLDDTYCLGFDCFWPSRVFNMWQHTEDIRAALKRRLSEVKALTRKKKRALFPESSVAYWRITPPDDADAEKRRLPFQPRSYRDFMLFERHYYGAAIGMTSVYHPLANKLGSLFSMVTGLDFPFFKPHALWYKQPIFYQSNHLAFYSDGASITYPSYCRYLDVELELGIVLGRSLYNASPDEATAAIAGFCVFNDFSARNTQMEEMASKAFANSISSTVVSADEVLPHIDHLSGRITINNVVVKEPRVDSWQFSLGQVSGSLTTGLVLGIGKAEGRESAVSSA